MQPEARKYLWDALEAANRITRFTHGKTLGSYQADELLRSAVERQFEITGEAPSQLRKGDPVVAAEIQSCPASWLSATF